MLNHSARISHADLVLASLGIVLMAWDSGFGLFLLAWAALLHILPLVPSLERMFSQKTVQKSSGK